jgi:hypothetical protein
MTRNVGADGVSSAPHKSRADSSLYINIELSKSVDNDDKGRTVDNSNNKHYLASPARYAKLGVGEHKEKKTSGVWLCSEFGQLIKPEREQGNVNCRGSSLTADATKVNLNNGSGIIGQQRNSGSTSAPQQRSGSLTSTSSVPNQTITEIERRFQSEIEVKEKKLKKLPSSDGNTSEMDK